MARKSTRSRRFLLFAGVFVLVMIVYWFSMCPSVYLIDSGELAATSYTLGIAHPTGYPLYTLLSYFFAHLPGKPIFNVNMFSALLSTLAVCILYLFACQVTKNDFVALLPACLFAFSPSLWRISVTNEVYPLTALFAVLILFILYNIHDNRHLLLLMYCIGLSLTNHVIIFALVIPVLVYLIIVYKPGLKHIIIGAVFICVGMTLYLYLIARTAGGVSFAWGGTYNFQRLIWHMSGKQYQVWMFSLSSQEIFTNILKGFKLMGRNFLYVFLIPVFLGFIEIWHQDRTRFWLFISIVLINILYAINYSIPDIESYYLPGFCTLLVVCVYGFERIRSYSKWYIVLPMIIALIFINYRACTLRYNTFAYDFSKAHIENLPRHSLVIFTFWDIYSPTLYYQHVEHRREDLVCIDKELLRRTWYISYLEHQYPQFSEQVKPAIESYLTELYKFEYGRPYDQQTIQSRYVQMLETFIRAKIDQGVYLAMPYPDNDLGQIRLEYPPVPYGFVIYIPKNPVLYQPFDFSSIDICNPSITYDERLIHNRYLISRIIQGNINYLLEHGYLDKADQARAWYKDFSTRK